MMMQSWMGSDFTNDDLVKEFTLVQDYTHTLVGTEQLQNAKTYKVELVPKANAAVSWGKIHYWVRTSDFVPRKAVYFNQRDERVRTMIFSEIQEMDNRVVPTHMEVIDEQDEGHKTVIDYQSITYNEPIDDAIFTRRNLERSR